MANLVSSIGYSIGKLHTGMIAYLCDLYRDGTSGPLRTFFDALKVEIPERPIAKREWKSIDLAIFNGEADKPQILVEMKVDDHDHETTKSVGGEKRRAWQTALYGDTFPDCDAYLYVTLGMGENFHAPHGPNFKWVRIRPFLTALDHIQTNDPAIGDWREAIRNEVDLQDAVRRNDRTRVTEYRSGAWNIYFLGYLKESFEEQICSAGGTIDPTCYTYGTAPDTILNFGTSPGHSEYLEINNNGRLNLKISLNRETTDEGKRRAIENLREQVKAAYPAGAFTFHDGGRLGASKTVASFDVGLSRSDGYLKFATGLKETLQRLQEFVLPFYRRADHR